MLIVLKKTFNVDDFVYNSFDEWWYQRAIDARHTCRAIA